MDLLCTHWLPRVQSLLVSTSTLVKSCLNDGKAEPKSAVPFS